MNIESFRAYCLSKKAVTESFPFDKDTLVFKVAGKIFALTALDAPNLTVNLKCDPERSLILREEYPEIVPGYHMNKKHWNSVHYNAEIGDKLFQELIDHSYNLVIKTLPAKLKKEAGLGL